MKVVLFGFWFILAIMQLAVGVCCANAHHLPAAQELPVDFMVLTITAVVTMIAAVFQAGKVFCEGQR